LSRAWRWPRHDRQSSCARNPWTLWSCALVSATLLESTSACRGLVDKVLRAVGSKGGQGERHSCSCGQCGLSAYLWLGEWRPRSGPVGLAVKGLLIFAEEHSHRSEVLTVPWFAPRGQGMEVASTASTARLGVGQNKPRRAFSDSRGEGWR
jgi:hypothetical protein